MPIVLENSGRIEPERIESYIAAGGYRALHHVLREMTPAEVVDGGHPQRPARPRRRGLSDRRQVGAWSPRMPGDAQVRRLQRRRGRPRRLHGPQRAGERPAPRPGGHGDRRATRSARARATSTSAASTRWPSDRLRDGHQAGEAARAARQPASSSSPFDFRIDLRIGAGAFVCGEETALMASIEGERGMPRPRPPYPAESGLWDCPTLINNVETFANIPPIIRNGAGVVRRHRHREEQGDQGLRAGRQDPQHRPGRGADGHAAAARSSRRSAAASPDGGTIKAVQTGGPSGGCIPAEHLDTPVDYESLSARSARSWAPAA